MPPSTPAPRTLSRFDAAMLVVSALAPAAFVAQGAASAAPASHDEAVVRVVGLGWTGLFRALDAIVAAPFLLVPVGTRALRAGLAGAGVTAVAGVLLFALAHALVTRAIGGVFGTGGIFGKDGPVDSRLISATSAVATLSALFSPAWQTEAVAPGTSALGAVLVLVVFATCVYGAHIASVVLALALAASYEPIVFAGALVAAIPWLLRRALLAEAARAKAAIGVALVVGLAPLVFGALLLSRDLASSASSVTSHVSLAALHGEFSIVVLASALVGAAISAVVPSARRPLASFLLLIVVGVVAARLGAPFGKTRVGAGILVGVCGLHALLAVGLSAIVVAVARAPVPFARASASLVVVLELVIPVQALDESAARRAERVADASTSWDEVAWGSLPPGGVLLVADEKVQGRIAAARAAGTMRGDLLVAPTLDVTSRAAHRALIAEPKLAPLYRDFALAATPEELSFWQLASERPVLVDFDRRWDRALARHFVPLGLTMRYEPEPRGASDRRAALESFASSKERLVKFAIPSRDEELAAVTASLLRARAIALAASNERELLSRALDDLRPFAPEDPVAAALVRRIVTTKGAIEVRDIAP